MKFDDMTNKWVMTDSIPYGDLQMMVDTNNRWTYRGSVTTPPCAQNVYWNVLRTVYPIKERHLLGFKKRLAQNPAVCSNPSNDKVCKPGNHRETLPLVAAHNPFIISDGADLTQNYRGVNLETQ